MVLRDFFCFEKYVRYFNIFECIYKSNRYTYLCMYYIHPFLPLFLWLTAHVDVPVAQPDGWVPHTPGSRNGVVSGEEGRARQDGKVKGALHQLGWLLSFLLEVFLEAFDWLPTGWLVFIISCCMAIITLLRRCSQGRFFWSWTATKTKHKGM